MKKVISILFPVLLIVVPLCAQNSINGAGSYGKSWVSTANSSAVLLNSSETFTGKWELCWDYTYISVVVKANKDSSPSGWKIQFSKSGTAATLLHEEKFSYSANDSVTNAKLVRVLGSYVRVIYTNTASAQTGTFFIETRLHARDAVPLTSDGKIDISGTVTVTGGASSANQTNGTQRTIPVNGSNQIIGVATSPFYTTPDYAKITVLDSLAASGGARADSAVYNPNSRYALVYIAITARTGADTLTIKAKSAGFRDIWGSNAFSLEDQLTRLPVADNTTIIITANTNRRFLMSIVRPEWILITRKTTNGVNKLNTIKVAFEGVNL